MTPAQQRVAVAAGALLVLTVVTLVIIGIWTEDSRWMDTGGTIAVTTVILGFGAWFWDQRR